jgi:predicted nucleotidyltransferase
MKNNDHLLELETTLLNAIKDVTFIDFAILFGSLAKNQSNNMSDVDLGIFTTRDVSLLELGTLTARIESILSRKVDIAVLNTLYKKRPLFTYEIITNGKVIFSRNDSSLIEFRRKSILYYLDVKDLINDVNESFKERLFQKKFGQRNYA